jgi:hypothetical protein
MRFRFPRFLFTLVLVASTAASSRAAGDGQADTKTVTTKTGEPHFEAPLPSWTLRLARGT